MRRCRNLTWLLVVTGFLTSSPLARAGRYEAAVEAAALQFANFVKETQGRQSATVRPHFLGLENLGGGGAAGFVEQFKLCLAPHNIKIGGRADYSLVAHLELSDDKKSASLVAEVKNQNGKLVHTIDTLPPIDDPRDLAEILGIPVDFGTEGDERKRQERWKKDFEGRVVLTAHRNGQPKSSLLVSDQSPKFGLGLTVGGQGRPIQIRDGLAYLRLDFGETYRLTLVNNTPQEMAVLVKVDGVNVFHFSDPTARREDGTKYKYWIVPPKDELEVQGWHKNDQRSLAFKTTTVEEGAAQAAGISLNDVGLVTATFHASWEGQNRPKDEPVIRREIPVQRMVPVEKERTVVMTEQSGGRTRQVQQTETYTEMVPVYESKVATGFGEEIFVNSQGVNRTIGVARATLAFRYDRKQR